MSSQRNGNDIDWHTVYETITIEKPAFVFDSHMILDGDALCKIGFKVMTIGQQLDLRQKHAAVIGDSVVLL